MTMMIVLRNESRVPTYKYRRKFLQFYIDIIKGSIDFVLSFQFYLI